MVDEINSLITNIPLETESVILISISFWIIEIGGKRTIVWWPMRFTLPEKEKALSVKVLGALRYMFAGDGA